MAMAAHLPPEVLLHILSLVVPFRFDVFPNNAAIVNLGFYDGYTIDRRRYPTYAACARVCKSWYSMAIRLLYHTIDLISPASYFLFFETIAIHNTSLAKYVQEFTGINTWLDIGPVAQRVDFPSYLARSLLKSLPTTKKLHLSAHFIPHLGQITSSESGRDILEVSGYDKLHGNARGPNYPLKSVLVALPPKLSSLILHHFDSFDEFEFYDNEVNSNEGSDHEDEYDSDDDWHRKPCVLPCLHALDMSGSILTPRLARVITTQAGTLRCLTLSHLFAHEPAGPASLQSLLLVILRSIGLYLEELTFTTKSENFLLTNNLLRLVPKLLRLTYNCRIKLHMPVSALLENLPTSLQALRLGFRRADISFVSDLFGALQKPSFLPDLATIPQIFLGRKSVDTNDAYPQFLLGEKRDRALASLRERHLEWNADESGCREWPSDSHRWSNSIWVHDFKKIRPVT